MIQIKTNAKKLQSGALGVFMCIVLVIIFGLIGVQNISSTSSDLYLSSSKQHIEVARQLAYAGLRHYTHNFGNDEAIDQLIQEHRGNTNIVGECSFTTPLPETLDPTVELASPNTPEDTLQHISIQGLIVPYNCDHPISEDNYRATFEIVASVNCLNNSSGVDSGCVKRSFVFNREDNDNGNLEYLPSQSPPPPYEPDHEQHHTEEQHQQENNHQPDQNNQPEPPPQSNSKGQQEVGF